MKGQEQRGREGRIPNHTLKNTLLFVCLFNATTESVGLGTEVQGARLVSEKAPSENLNAVTKT